LGVKLTPSYGGKRIIHIEIILYVLMDFVKNNTKIPKSPTWVFRDSKINNPALKGQGMLFL
jgi:hypothetical protein